MVWEVRWLSRVSTLGSCSGGSRGSAYVLRARLVVVDVLDSNVNLSWDFV